MQNFPDLSHWDDGNVSYHAMWNAGIRMVGLKATEGAKNTDQSYQDAYRRAKSVGFGVISFAFLDNDNGAISDDIHFESVAHLGSGDIACIDAEALGLTKVATFAAMDFLLSKGMKTTLYCNRDYYQNVLHSPTQYLLWLADYGSFPELPTDVELFAHQWTDVGTCPGVTVLCDMNRVHVTDDAFKGYLIS